MNNRITGRPLGTAHNLFKGRKENKGSGGGSGVDTEQHHQYQCSPTPVDVDIPVLSLVPSSSVPIKTVNTLYISSVLSSVLSLSASLGH